MGIVERAAALCHDIIKHVQHPRIMVDVEHPREVGAGRQKRGQIFHPEKLWTVTTARPIDIPLAILRQLKGGLICQHALEIRLIRHMTPRVVPQQPRLHRMGF